MVLKMVLNFGDYAGFRWFGGLCWILVILKLMLVVDGFEDDAEF